MIHVKHCQTILYHVHLLYPCSSDLEAYSLRGLRLKTQHADIQLFQLGKAADWRIVLFQAVLEKVSDW